jgi:hypothetical protein
MTNEQTKVLQRVMGTFLYYARVVDPTLLHALNDLASAQTKGTQATADAMVHLLNYNDAPHPQQCVVPHSTQIS